MSKLSYFQNTNTSMSPALLAEVHRVIEENKRYAVAVWKSRADDALDATLMHVIKYYSLDKGDLRNYVVATMRNILTNSLKREVSIEDDTLHYHVDKEATQSLTTSIDTDEVLLDFASVEDDVVDSCIKEFLPYVVEDYQFFRTLENPTLQEGYSKVLSNHSPKTILLALKYIKDNYVPLLNKFMSIPEALQVLSQNRRGYALEGIISRYSNPNIKVIGLKGNTLVLKSLKGEGTSISGGISRPVYKVNLLSMALFCYRYLYGVGGSLHATHVAPFVGATYFRLLSGVIVKDDVNLVLNSLQEEIAYYFGKVLGYTFLGKVEEDYFLVGRSPLVEVQVADKVFSFELPVVNKKEV